MTVTELLSRAKQAIAAGEMSLRVAAEDISAAQKQGATQRQIAEAIGKSAAWVNRLLKWRESDYQDDTAFGAQSKASRQRAKRVHSAEREMDSAATTSEQAQAAAARARAETAKAEAEKAKADARKSKEEARARAYAQSSGTFSDDSKKLESGQRERLVKLLGMLGSNLAGERENAAVAVEKHRRILGMSWDELIIPDSVAVHARAA